LAIVKNDEKLVLQLASRRLWRAWRHHLQYLASPPASLCQKKSPSRTIPNTYQTASFDNEFLSLSMITIRTLNLRSLHDKYNVAAVSHCPYGGLISAMLW